ncbi:hypothetical protein BP5796_08157 [Coleophoma crateriformis]|uniref:Uncharacterized protein n=1 Tax=Coleophoma crateriformis TaxID=565419 RepID=A0A3D8RDI5_9HELO|nr:hypothetical protein BP5796_08157 [Coleophoma crateriformis]
MATFNTQKARRYALEEILGLRDSLSVVLCPVTRIPQQHSIENILRIPKEALEKPQTFYCKTKDLVAELSRFKREHPLAYRRGYSSAQAYSDESLGRPENSHSHPIRGIQRVHWHLRKPDSSDRSEPYSAPSSLAAQQSENFQRFYRAVVSPTHVRVTAGGRIVPNTRMPVQPTFECNAEQYLFEPRNLNNPTDFSQPQPNIWDQGTFDLGSIPPSAYSSIPGLVTEAMPTYNAPGTDRVATTPIMACPKQQVSTEGEAAAPVAEPTRRGESDPVKISHPSQFDQTKPFMYNGHLVYPAPAGFQPPANTQPLPITMLAAPNFLPPGMMGGLPLHGSPFFPANPLGMMAAGQPQPTMFPNGSLRVSHGFPAMLAPPPAFAPFAPLHPNSFPLSEHTKQLLQSYRMQLEQLNAGITHLDQEQLTHTRNSLGSQIMMLETMLNEQLKNERAFAEGYARETENQKSLIADNSTSANITSRTESAQQSRLSATAAMAPPFKPRSQSKAVPITRPVTPVTPFQPEIVEISQEAMDEIESRFLSKVEWSEPRKPDAAHKEPIRVNLPKAHTMHFMTHLANGNVDVDYTHTLKQSNTYHAHSESIQSPSAGPSVLPKDVPYLVGAFPKGAQASGAAVGSLTYPRPLNEDEICARHLYWGKAPRSAFKGLPKFDGKDFYPASPTKAPILSAAQTPVCFRNNTTTPDFTNLFLENSNSPLSFTSAAAHGNGSQPPPGPEHRALHNLPAQNFAYGAVYPPQWYQQNPLPGLVLHGQNDSGYAQLFSGHPAPALNPPPAVQLDASELKKLPQVDDNDARSLDSWGLPTHGTGWPANTEKAAGSDHSSSSAHSNASTVEIHLTSQKPSHKSPKTASSSSTFAERVAAVSNTAQQTKFLQNILRNTAKAAPALSGTVSATTAEGFLPQYRGSAAASLAPTMNTSPNGRTELREVEKDVTTHVTSKTKSENLPLDNIHPFRPAPPEAMGAEDYMRYVTAKDDGDKKNKEGAYGAKMPALGPIMGSEW